MDAAKSNLVVEDLAAIDPRRPVWSGVSLRVASTDRILVTGDNGSGKTTLLRCLAGSRKPACGHIFWNGKRLSRSREWAGIVGMVAHESRLYDDLTVLENIVFAARMCGLPRPRTLARDWLAQTGLSNVKSVLPPTLPRGTRQRAVIARALVHRPPVWLLDEPASGLDASGVAWLTELVKDHCDQGGQCIMASHRTSLWMPIVQRHYRLGNGTLRDISRTEDDACGFTASRGAA